MKPTTHLCTLRRHDRFGVVRETIQRVSGLCSAGARVQIDGEEWRIVKVQKRVKEAGSKCESQTQ